MSRYNLPPSHWGYRAVVKPKTGERKPPPPPPKRSKGAATKAE